MLTYNEALSGVSDQVISETARRFVSNAVESQSATFAPSVAEFAQEARRVARPVNKYAYPALPKPEPELRLSPAERARMRLKMPMYQYANANGKMHKLAKANKQGHSAMIALAVKWGIEVPAELLEIPGDQAEREWQTARNKAWAEIERNPPKFMRRRAA